MSLFPLTYRLCNPIIELPPPGLRLAAAFRSRKRVQKYNRQTKQPNFSMTFFKLFYTTDTQNTRLAHRTPLENKNINARKKITGKTRKNTPRPADNEKQHGRKHKAKSNRTAKKRKRGDVARRCLRPEPGKDTRPARNFPNLPGVFLIIEPVGRIKSAYLILPIGRFYILFPYNSFIGIIPFGMYDQTEST